MIRQTIGKWWKAASEEDKRPFLAQSQAAQAQADSLRKQWNIDVAKWDSDAVRVRQEIVAEEQQQQQQQQQQQFALPAPLETGAPISDANAIPLTVEVAHNGPGETTVAAPVVQPPLVNEVATEPMVLS
jgi:lysine-specific histone demethylase 1